GIAGLGTIVAFSIALMISLRKPQ
ncbi:MAG: hypothetical protein RL091_3635, partial [Verrucomicrobiota bacterium]